MHGTGWELGLEEGTPRGPRRGSPRQYLALHQHGHVHKHVMQLTDAGFQFDSHFDSSVAIMKIFSLFLVWSKIVQTNIKIYSLKFYLFFIGV